MSLSTVDSAATRAYFVWRASHPTEAAILDDIPPDVVGALWAACWKAASWDAVKRNATLGLNLTQIIQRLEEIAHLYADVEIDQRLSDELERSSEYWRGEA